jgi:hypothetical protein
MSLKLRVIVDAAGRTIIGESDSETKTSITLKNPATLFIQPNQQTGQLAVQLIPFFFREFVEEEKRPEGVSWTFDKSSLAISEQFGLDIRLLDQYEKMMTKEANTNPPPIEDAEAFGAAASKAKEVKLFDESTEGTKEPEAVDG